MTDVNALATAFENASAVRQPGLGVGPLTFENGAQLGVRDAMWQEVIDTAQFEAEASDSQAALFGRNQVGDFTLTLEDPANTVRTYLTKYYDEESDTRYVIQQHRIEPHDAMAACRQSLDFEISRHGSPQEISVSRIATHMNPNLPKIYAKWSEYKKDSFDGFSLQDTRELFEKAREFFREAFLDMCNGITPDLQKLGSVTTFPLLNPKEVGQPVAEASTTLSMDND